MKSNKDILELGEMVSKPSWVLFVVVFTNEDPKAMRS